MTTLNLCWSTSFFILDRGFRPIRKYTNYSHHQRWKCKPSVVIIKEEYRLLFFQTVKTLGCFPAHHGCKKWLQILLLKICSSYRRAIQIQPHLWSLPDNLTFPTMHCFFFFFVQLPLSFTGMSSTLISNLFFSSMCWNLEQNMPDLFFHST